MAEKSAHPEDCCGECGGPNITWYVKNDLWDKVADKMSKILCPICFVKKAEVYGIKPTAWRLSCEGDLPEVEQQRMENVKQAEEIIMLRKTLRHLDRLLSVHLDMEKAANQYCRGFIGKALPPSQQEAQKDE